MSSNNGFNLSYFTTSYSFILDKRINCSFLASLISFLVESIPRLHNNITNEALINKSTIDEIAAKLRLDVKPVNNTTFPPNYRKKMVEVLCKKALDGMKGELT